MLSALASRSLAAIVLLSAPITACGDSDSGSESSSGDATTQTSADATTADASGSENSSSENSSETTSESTSSGDTDNDTDSDSATDSTTAGGDEDLVMTPDDFTCILEWDKVRNLRLTNLLGYQAEALAVANSPDGGVYPVGTVIQLVPTEAMVKRKAGTSPTTGDWEFFFLGVSQGGTTIEARGHADVVNGFGGNCFDCHAKAAPQWDFICEKDHGCDPLPFTDEQIEQVQNSDPRCE